MMLGIFLAQFCINAITYFFITWFPVYLVQQRHMSILNAGIVASIPAICGFGGGVLGGVWSDALIRRGWSLTAARKTPIVAGMLVSMSMVACNFVDAAWLVVALMALSFFGKGVGALGWAVISDAAPREIAGLSGALFNMFGNISSITTPIVIGFIIQTTGSFDWALVFIGGNALVAIVSYLFVVGEISAWSCASRKGRCSRPPDAVTPARHGLTPRATRREPRRQTPGRNRRRRPPSDSCRRATGSETNRSSQTVRPG